MTSIGIAVSESLGSLRGKTVSLLFDSVNPMLISISSQNITRFVHFTTTNLRLMGLPGIFLPVEKGLDPDMLTRLTTFVDEVVDVEKNSRNRGRSRSCRARAGHHFYTFRDHNPTIEGDRIAMSSLFRGNPRPWYPHALVAGCSLAVLALTVFSLMQGINTVFMHLYYLPLVLAGYYYRRRGIPLIVALSLAYLSLVAWFDWPSYIEIGAGAVRAGVFVLIGSMVAVLSERLFVKSSELESVFGNLQDIVYRADNTGNLVMASPSWAGLLGYASAEECLGKNLARDFFLDPAAREIFLRELAGEGRVTGYFITLKRRDGSPVIVSASCHYWFGKDGKIAGDEGIFRDVTRQQQLERELRESEEKFRQFFNNINDAVYIHRIHADGRPGRIVEVNDVMCLRLGYSRDELLAMDMTDLVTAEGREKIPDIAEKIRHDGHATFETFHTAKDGTIVPVEVNTSLFIQKGERLALASARDITERLESESALRASEQRLRNIIENMQEGLAYCRMMYDEEGRPADFVYLAVNPMFDRIIGAGVVIGRPVTEVFPGIREAFPQLFEIYGRVTRTGVAESFDIDFSPARKWLHISVYSPSAGHFVAIFTDITERKRAAEALRESEERFREIFDKANDAIEIFEVDEHGVPGRFIDVNETGCRMMQYEKNELLQHNPLDFDLTDYSLPPYSGIGGKLSAEGFVIFETVHKRKDGTTFPVEVNSHLIMLQGKKAGLAIVRDITDRKRAEETIRRSAREWQTTFDAIHDAVFLLSAEGRILRHNRAFETLTGRSGGDIDGQFCYRILHESLYPIAGCPNVRAAVSRQRESLELQMGDRWYIASVDPLIAESGRVTGAVHLITDITGRKRNEEALRASEERFRRFFEMNNAVMLLIDPVTGQILDANPSAVAFYGYSRDRIRSMHIEDINRLPAEEVALMRKQIAERTRQSFVAPHRLADGSLRTVEVYSSPVQAGTSSYLFSIIHDITEKKKTEEALSENQRRLAEAMDLAHLANWEFDVRTGIFTFDARFYALYGTTPEREGGTLMPASVYVKEFVHPDDAEEVGRIIRETIERKNPSAFTQAEHRIIRRDGQVRHIIVRFSVVLDEKGEAVSTHGVNQDITERRQMETALQDSERRLLDIINFLPDPTFVIDRDGRVIAWNLAIQALTGVPQDEILGKGEYEYAFQLFGRRRPMLIDLVIHPEPAVIRDHYRNVRRTGDLLSGQFHVSSLRGRAADLWIVATPLLNRAGEITGAIETIRDITEIKNTENALKDLNQTLEQRVAQRTSELENAQQYTRRLIEADLDPLVLITTDGLVRDVNTATERMTGVARDALIGTHFADYIAEKERVRTGFASVLEKGLSAGNRLTVLGRGGVSTPVSASAVLFRDSGGLPAGVFVSLHDITRILQDEEQIGAQLREKEVLLREIHHRVKNNLQIIVSLISLQSRAISDQAVVDALRDTQNRVRAISLVHERLHMSKDVGTIDFGGYLRYLGTSLIAFYQKNPADIRLTIGVGDIVLDIDTASPLGLIFNELISNMLKYAFPGGRKGECRIGAQKEGRTLTLTIQDNGAGIPPDLDWKTGHTLGLRLVNILIEQLKGTITLDRTGGTKFTITVTLPEHETGIHRVEGL